MANEFKAGSGYIHGIMPTAKLESAPDSWNCGWSMFLFSLAASSVSPLSPVLKHCRLAFWVTAGQESSSGSVLHGGAQAAENKPQKRDLIKESSNGPDPKLLHGNLDAPGYQPGAPVSVSKLPRLLSSVIRTWQGELDNSFLSLFFSKETMKGMLFECGMLQRHKVLLLVLSKSL